MPKSAPAPKAPAATPAAQAPPKASAPAVRKAPDDTPSIKVGATLFTDYTYTDEPTAKDAGGNTIHPSAFNVGRAYVNVTGNISHLVSFRFTPDIARETGAGSSLNGSLTYRVKYAFAQFNLDDWMVKGSWIRLGMQQTPVVDLEEGIYRYRFQGPVFADREGYLTSSDAGVSFRTSLPGTWGDVHVGYYNGDGYSKAEANDQKAFQVRGTVRPFAAVRPVVLRQIRVTAFYDADHYMRDASRRRFQSLVTFEHRYLNAAFDYLRTRDQKSIAATAVEGSGYSIWCTPRSTVGVEGLLRYDDMTVDRSLETHHRRTIAGVSYWFPRQGGVSSAVLLDFEQLRNVNFQPAQPTQRRLAVHALVNF